MSNMSFFSVTANFKILLLNKFRVMQHRVCLGNGFAVGESLPILTTPSMLSVSSIDSVW